MLFKDSAKILIKVFEFCQCLLTFRILKNTKLGDHTLSNPSFLFQIICNNAIFA